MFVFIFKKSGTCRCDAKFATVGIANFTSLPQYDETILMQAVATKGPVAVAICANCVSFINCGLEMCIIIAWWLFLDNFFSLRGGIYNDPLCTYLCIVDHTVTIVGYDTTTDDATLYWMYFIRFFIVAYISLIIFYEYLLLQMSQ